MMRNDEQRHRGSFQLAVVTLSIVFGHATLAQW